MANSNLPLDPDELGKVLEASRVTTAAGSDDEGWVAATVNCLDRTVTSVALKQGTYPHFEHVGLSANQPVGAQMLALCVREAIQKAQKRALEKLHSQVVRQAPRPDPWDEYWALAEHERPESYEEFLAHRPKTGGQAGPEEQIAADDKAGIYRDRTAQVDLAPERVRTTPPGELHDELVAGRYDRLADELARVAAIPATAVFTAADDKSDPTVAVTVDRGGNITEVWLHQDVFRRIGSDKLGMLVAKTAARAHEGMLAMLLVDLGDEE